jgi:two-component sensor histidine kinase
MRHYSTLDGLPSNTNYQIYQDSHKFIWFTSDAGVTKFDGSNFTSYRKKDGLSSNDIVRIKEDFRGRIWLFSYNGAVNYIYNNIIYNGKNAPFLNSLMGKGFILDFFTDANHTINFYNWQRECFALDTNNKITRDELLKNITINLPFIGKEYYKLKVLNLNKSQAGEWIIGTITGIYSQHTLQSRIKIIDTSAYFYGIYPVGENTFYVPTNHRSILKFSGDFQKEEIPFPRDQQKIKTIIEDSEGYLWIAAYDEGVYCLKNNKVVRHFDIKDALGLLQDHEQNIWVSTQSEGIYVINHDLLGQNHFDCTNFDNYGVNLLSDFPGMGICCTNTKAAFIVNKGVFYKLAAPKYLQPVNILYLYQDQTLLLGSISSRLNTYKSITLNIKSREIDYTNSTSYNLPMKKIIDDRSGKVTAMFDQNRIYYINSIKPELNFNFHLISERINNAYYNADNELVINAKKNYLYRANKLEPYPDLSRFNGTIISDHLVIDDAAELFNIDGDSLYILNNHKFYNLTDAFDMPVDMQINKILYKDSTLYLSTLKDIFVCHNPLRVLSGDTLQIQPLNISFNNINDILIHNDSLYIATEDGLTIIAEKSIAKSRSIPPIPYLRSITINDKIFSLPDQELKLTGKNKIQLSFGCISYSSSPVIYSYMLDGSENKWTVGSGSSINLVYQNLPRGHYVFKLRARKSNSGWSKPLELVITIKPTLLEYPAFWAFAVLIAAGLIFLIILRIRSQKIKRVEVNHQLIVMEQMALQSMMNPHFIFNSLGSIQNFLLKNKGSEAVIYLTQFAQLIRQNLNAVNTPMIILEEEVDRLRNYLDLEKKRLDYKFDYSIEIDKRFEEDRVYIPSMLIQPIAENSIWHGLATLKENGFIKIRIQEYNPKSLIIIIEDNGIGVKKSNEYSAKNSHHKHLGMQIIEKRLYLLSKKYNTKTGINYSEGNPDQNYPGTIVELILPFIDNINN